jgi:hypothetical protein
MPTAFGGQDVEHFYRGDRRNERSDTADQKDLKGAAKKKLGKKAKVVPQVGANANAPGALDTLAHILKKAPEARNTNVLDEYIYNQGVADVPFGKIAADLGMNTQAVRDRYFELLNERNGGSPEQMRMHLLAQLKTIINSMQEAATNGSVDHVKMWILAIERISKLLDLESQKAEITFNIVSDAQAQVIINAVMYVVQSLKEVPAIAKAVDPMVIDATVSKALTQASEYVYESTDRRIDAEGAAVVA